MFFFVWQLISINGNILWFAYQVNPGYVVANKISNLSVDEIPAS